MTCWNALRNRVCAAALLGAALSPSAFAVPTLSFSSAANAAVGTSVVINVGIAAVTDLYGYNFSVRFNPALLQVTNTSEGGFLGSAGATYFDGGSIDNSLGVISYAFDTLLGPGAGANGAGVLEYITFRAVGVGTSTLSFADTLFLTSTSDDIGVQFGTGSVTTVAGNVPAVPEPGTWALLGLGLGAVAFGRRRAVV